MEAKNYCDGSFQSMDLHENNTELVYLDQSILDWFVKGKLSDLGDALTVSEGYKAVYSPEILQEIARIKDSGDRQRFFDCLEDLGAQYLTVDEYGSAHLSDSNPTQVFESFMEQQAQFGKATDAMAQFLFLREFLSG